MSQTSSVAQETLPLDDEDDTERQILETVDRLIVEEVEPRAAEIDATDEFPWDLCRKAAALGLTALAYPAEYGGLDVRLRTQFRVVERLSRSSATFGLIISSGPDSMVPLRTAGTAAQKQAVLPKMASGEWLSALSISEPGGGSDVGAMKTRAVREGDVYVLDGTKAWCTQGPIANIITVFAKTDPVAGNKGITAFLLPPDTPGVTFPRSENLVGLRGCPTSQMHLDGVRIPVENRIGEEGDGFKLSMICLDEARMNVCAQAVGVAYRCIGEAIEYAKQRVAFGQPIMHHQGIQFLLAELATELAAARSLWLMAVHELERGPTRKASSLASMAKNACTKIGMKAPIEAIQVFGGAGLSKELPLERMMRDAKAFQIFDGPTQIHNMIVGRHLEKAGLPFD